MAQQKLSIVEGFNAIPFWKAMTILVCNWAGNIPVLVALLRCIEKHQYRLSKLLQMNKFYRK